MTNLTKRLNSTIGLTLSWVALELSRFIKFSVAIGAGHSLSVVTIVAPFIGLQPTLIAACGKALYFTYFLQTSWAYALVLQLPLLAAVLLYQVSARRVNSLFFAMAIGLFIANPVGAEAWAYAMVWCIPALALVMAPGAILTRALASTFAAHAVGALVCLYANTLTADVWVALIPAVLVERGLLTVGLLAMGTVVSFVRERLPELKSTFALVK